MTVRVQEADFDVGAELAALTLGNHAVGGLGVFVGLVRDIAGDSEVAGMTLEHYPGMTERQLSAIEAEARARWPLEASLIIHRVGRLQLGERIVLVACASAHRQAALDATGFLIDWLKTKAPFWKREETPDGDHWVDARESDETAAARWGR
jgi:molybdopterin synthase catalytic subunit